MELDVKHSIQGHVLLLPHDFSHRFFDAVRAKILTQLPIEVEYVFLYTRPRVHRPQLLLYEPQVLRKYFCAHVTTFHSLGWQYL